MSLSDLIRHPRTTIQITMTNKRLSKLPCTSNTAIIVEYTKKPICAPRITPKIVATKDRINLKMIHYPTIAIKNDAKKMRHMSTVLMFFSIYSSVKTHIYIQPTVRIHTDAYLILLKPASARKTPSPKNMSPSNILSELVSSVN